jgi:hypothetical protein
MILTKRGIPFAGHTHWKPIVVGTALDRPDAAKIVGNAQPQPREASRRGGRRRCWWQLLLVAMVREVSGTPHLEQTLVAQMGINWKSL